MMRVPTFGQFQNEADLIAQQYAQMGKLEQQASSGKKLLSPSDDPVLASQLQSIQDYINSLNTYTDNGALAGARNKLFDTANTQLVSTLSDIQTQLNKARNGTTNASDRADIAKTLQSDLTKLLATANTTDQNGQYIFSGSNASSPSYVLVGNSYQYQGGPNVTNIDIGPNATALYNDIGSQVFGNIPTGNGTFTVSASGSNTGTGILSNGTVVNSTSYVPDTYTISIVTNNEGVPGIKVVGASSGQVIPASGGDPPAYNPGTSGQDITFNGLTVNLSTGASLGDSFTVQPSTKQNAFDTIQNAINTMQNSSLSTTSFQQQMSAVSASVAQILNRVTDYQAQSGSREQNTNTQLTANQQTLSDQTITQSNLGNADITQVFSSLMQQSIALQATQESYLKIEQTLTTLLQNA